MKHAAIVSVVCVALAACSTQGTKSQDGTETYQDPAGWAVDLPPGWHAVPFETSKGNATATGALISNVVLPSPSIVPGYPIQTNGADLPGDGIAFVVALDDDPDAQQPPASPPSPPLTLDEFTQGSAPPGSPTLDSLWFSGNGQTLLATIEIGPNATSADLASLAAVVSSLRFD